MPESPEGRLLRLEQVMTQLENQKVAQSFHHRMFELIVCSIVCMGGYAVYSVTQGECCVSPSALLACFSGSALVSLLMKPLCRVSGAASLPSSGHSSSVSSSSRASTVVHKSDSKRINFDGEDEKQTTTTTTTAASQQQSQQQQQQQNEVDPITSLCEQFDLERASNKTSSFPAKEYIARLEQARQQQPNNVDVLFRLARAHYNAGNVEVGGDKRKLFQAGLMYATQALKLRKTKDTHKWVALLSMAIGNLSSTQQRLECGLAFYENTKSALAFDPNDEELLHMQGRFVYEISKFSWVKKKAVQAVFGSLPDVSMTEAIQAFEKVALAKPDWLVNSFFLAKAHKYMGNLTKCEKLLQYVARAKSNSVEDQRTIDAAKKMLKHVVY